MAYDSPSPARLAEYGSFPGGVPLQALNPTGTRVNATGGAVGSAGVAVPAGGNVVMIRADGPAWIRFGSSAGMAVAAADTGCIMFVTGEAPYFLRNGETFFSVARVGATNVNVQLESVSTLT